MAMRSLLERVLAICEVIQATLLAIGACAAPALAADKIAVGVGGSVGDTPLYIAEAKGYFKQLGLEVTIFQLDSGAKVIAPLGTGELDVGSGALSVAFYNAVARGISFKVVADRGHTAPGYNLYQTIFIRKDLIDSGQFKSLADLKGRRMGFAASGVASLSVLNEATKLGGITFDDVEKVFMPFPQMIAAFENKAIDGTIYIEPQATIMIKRGIGVRFLDTESFYPGQQISVIFYSDKFANERAGVAQRFAKAWLMAVRDYNDALAGGRLIASGAEPIVDIVANAFNLKPELVRDIYSHAVSPEGKVNVTALQKDLDFFVGKGWVPATVELSTIVDTTFVAKANAELGPYERKTN